MSGLKKIAPIQTNCDEKFDLAVKCPVDEASFVSAGQMVLFTAF
jgi:hypothetical protein